MKKINIPLDIRERSKNRTSLILSVVTLIFLCLLVHTIDKTFYQAELEAQEKEEAQAQANEKTQKEELSKKTASFLVTGDNFYGENLLSMGENEEGDWNYDSVYLSIKDTIASADLSIVQQPIVLTTDHSMVSGTDSYTSPIEVGDALANAGFDVIASAGSHSDDYGVNYLNMTLDFWKSSHSDLTILGLHSSQEEADTIQVKNVNGIRVALLDYAFGSNYDALPEDYAYMVDYFEKEKVTSDIEKAKEISDCIIVLAQWGTQGYALPDEFQKEWAQYLLSQGVTVLVGSHPHVLQPYEMLSDDQGNEMLVYYSLGDFVTDSTDAPSLLGGLARFTLEKTEVDGETKVKISDQTLVPTVMHYNTGEQVYQTMLLSDYTDELAQAHSIQAQEDCPTFCVASLEHLFDYITQLTPGEAASTQLLDLTYQADGSMVGADGSMLSADEIEFHYPIDTSGSMDALKAVLNEVEASNTYSQDDTSDDAEDDSLLDSEYNSDDEDESLW